jgi:hypothetical protein
MLDFGNMPSRPDMGATVATGYTGAALNGIHPEFDFFLDYFGEKTGGSRLPCRADVVPGELTAFLPGIVLMKIEYNDSGNVKDLIFGLMGTRVAGFYGERTGKSVNSVDNDESPPRIFNAVENVLENRAPYIIMLNRMSSERFFLKVGGLYVPLSEDGNNIDKIFVYVLTETQ